MIYVSKITADTFCSDFIWCFISKVAVLFNMWENLFLLVEGNYVALVLYHCCTDDKVNTDRQFSWKTRHILILDHKNLTINTYKQFDAFKAFRTRWLASPAILTARQVLLTTKPHLCRWNDDAEHPLSSGSMLGVPNCLIPFLFALARGFHQALDNSLMRTKTFLLLSRRKAGRWEVYWHLGEEATSGNNLTWENLT